MAYGVSVQFVVAASICDVTAFGCLTETPREGWEQGAAHRGQPDSGAVQRSRWHAQQFSGNNYSQAWADTIVGDFQDRSLDVIKNRLNKQHISFPGL